MNSNGNHEAEGNPGPSSSLGLDDVLFTLFRHKFLILCFVGLGFIAAAVVRSMKPPMYESTAKINIPYVVSITGENPTDPGASITRTGSGGLDALNPEVDLFRSLDTAVLVASNVGPSKILAAYGGGSNLMAAAGLVSSGVMVEPPRTTTLVVSFRHRDRNVVQPVMEELINIYKYRHLQMRQGSELFKYLTEQADLAREKLGQTEEQLRQLKSQAGLVNIRETEAALQKRITSLEDEILEIRKQEMQRKAELGDFQEGTTKTDEAVPAEIVSEYFESMAYLEETRKRIGLLVIEYKALHPEVIKARETIQNLSNRISGLRLNYPMLTNLLTVTARDRDATNSAALDPAARLVEIKQLRLTLESLEGLKSSLQAEATRLMEIEPKISLLERQRQSEENNYNYYLNTLDRIRSGDPQNSGGLVNMSIIDTPTPPRLDTKKLMKLIGAAFAACVGAGLGLAFLFDLVLDRTIRRTIDVTRHVRMPVFLSVPDSRWSGPKLLPWAGRKGISTAKTVSKREARLAEAVAPWSPDHHMQSQIEGLRERLLTHFEANRVNHSPKLVGLTACNHGAGVTTLASGLAASLSRTGNGSVLLVDLNCGEGTTHSFYRGGPGCGPSEDLDENLNGDGPGAEGTMGLTKLSQDKSWENLTNILPSAFHQAVPKLKATEYDFVVFDLPPASHTSPTPRFALQMDLVLMLIEAGKTKKQTARKALDLMSETRANVVAILNKYRNYVPPMLSGD